MGQVGLLAEPVGDPLSDLSVHLGLQRLRASEGELGPQGFLPGGHLGVDLRADGEGVELPRFQLADDQIGEGVVPRREVLAHPARARIDMEELADRPTPDVVRIPVTDLPEETAEARIAERPLPEPRGIDRASGGQDLVHASATGRRLKASREQEQTHEEVREDNRGHQDVLSVPFLREGHEAEEDPHHRREDEDEDAEAEVALRCEGEQRPAEGARWDRLLGNRMPGEGHEDEPEEQDGDRDHDAGSEDMVDETVHVLHFRDYGASQVRGSLPHDAKADPGRDQIGTPGRNSRATIAVPRTTRKRANANRTFEDFACSRSRVPKFVPENTPMMTMAARPGSTRPCE